jgi:hypothetical protein
MLTCVSSVGTKTAQLVVASARPLTDTGASAKGVVVASLDPWVHFCAAADGRGEIVGAFAAEGVAAAVARQLCYVSFFCFFLTLIFVTSSDYLCRSSCVRGASESCDLAARFQEEMTGGQNRAPLDATY